MEQKELDAYIKAGKIASQAREYGKELIKTGAKVLEVIEKIEQKITELGGEFAFPPQISINDVAAHYCPAHDDETVFKDGDVVKLDVGVHIDGFVGDTALTVVLSDDQLLNELKEASREALNSALKIVRPGVTLSEIGKAISKEITKRGFTPVKNLSGHGLARYIIHDSPSIPNFEIESDEELEDGQVIAIEPFASTGAGMIYESSNPTLFSLIGKKPIRSLFTRDVLKDIEKYEGLPFTTRWLVKKHGIGKTNFALRELRQLELLREYPPLPDKAHGIVSQAEHTIIVKDKPIVTTL